MAPHTSSLAFSFLACACALLGGCSAHAKSCFFFSGVCLCPVGMAPHTPNLAFSFLACACALLGMAPHTPSLAFSFLACTCALLGLLRTRQILLFLFWRVPVPCWDGSAHAKSCFFFSGVCLCPVGNGSAHAKSCFFSYVQARRFAGS